MKHSSRPEAYKAVPGRLSKAERRRQLLDMALVIVREEGADRLTLGHLAARAGVSKPVPYEHFGTRSGLLIELYKSLDKEQANALREALRRVQRNLKATANVLATAYIHCSADTSGEWHAVGAALSGSEEMGAVHQELIDGLSTGQKIQDSSKLYLPLREIQHDLTEMIKSIAEHTLGFATMLFKLQRLELS